MKLPLREEPEKVLIRIKANDGPIRKDLKQVLLKIQKNHPKVRGLTQNWAWIEAMKEWLEKHN
jgi:hypothetical protein